MCTGLVLGNVATSFWVVELQKDGLQIPVKNFWASDCEQRESFSKYVENATI